MSTTSISFAANSAIAGTDYSNKSIKRPSWLKRKAIAFRQIVAAVVKRDSTNSNGIDHVGATRPTRSFKVNRGLHNKVPVLSQSEFAAERRLESVNATGSKVNTSHDINLTNVLTSVKDGEDGENGEDTGIETVESTSQGSFGCLTPTYCYFPSAFADDDDETLSRDYHPVETITSISYQSGPAGVATVTRSPIRAVEQVVKVESTLAQCKARPVESIVYDNALGINRVSTLLSLVLSSGPGAVRVTRPHIQAIEEAVKIKSTRRKTPSVDVGLNRVTSTLLTPMLSTNDNAQLKVVGNMPTPCDPKLYRERLQRAGVTIGNKQPNHVHEMKHVKQVSMVALANKRSQSALVEDIQSAVDTQSAFDTQSEDTQSENTGSDFVENNPTYEWKGLSMNLDRHFAAPFYISRSDPNTIMACNGQPMNVYCNEMIYTLYNNMANQVTHAINNDGTVGGADPISPSLPLSWIATKLKFLIQKSAEPHQL